MCTPTSVLCRLWIFCILRGCFQKSTSTGDITSGIAWRSWSRDYQQRALDINMQSEKGRCGVCRWLEGNSNGCLKLSESDYVPRRKSNSRQESEEQILSSVRLPTSEEKTHASKTHKSNLEWFWMVSLDLELSSANYRISRFGTSPEVCASIWTGGIMLMEIRPLELAQWQEDLEASAVIRAEVLHPYFLQTKHSY